MRKLLPVPDIEIKKINKDHLRICNCGECKVCRQRETNLKYYRRHHAERLLKQQKIRERNKNASDDIDMDKLNAYWEKVKTI